MKSYTEEQMNMASKCSPYPWKKTETGAIKGSMYRTTVYSATVDHLYSIVADVLGHTEEEMEHNMAIIHVAPEAIEFIAELMNILDYNHGVAQNISIPSEMINRAEEILKKAYNLQDNEK